MQNADRSFCILHSAFCILHSAYGHSFHVASHRSCGPTRSSGDAPWHRLDPGLHGSWNPGDCQRSDTGSAARGGRPGHPREHLPPGSAAWRRGHCPAGRFASFQRLGRPHSDRQRRLSDLQPGPEPANRRPSCGLPVAHRRGAPGAESGKGRGHPGEPGLGHRHVPGRMSSLRNAPGLSSRCSSAYHPLGGALPDGPPSDEPGSFRHRAGRNGPGAARPLCRGARSSSISRGTPWEVSAWARPPSKCKPL